MEKLTAKTLSERTGCSRYHIAEILKGKRRPSVKLAKKIEDETGKPWTSWFESPSYVEEKHDGGLHGQE